MSKKPVFWKLKCPKNGLFWHFNWLLGPFFRRVQNGIFQTFKCTFGVSGFRGSVAGQGVRNSWVFFWSMSGLLWFFLFFKSGKKKNNKHKHFRRDGVRDKQEPSLGQMGPLPGTKWDPSLGQTGLSLFNSTVKSPFCPVCPWDGWGFVPGTIVPQGPSEK